LKTVLFFVIVAIQVHKLVTMVFYKVETLGREGQASKNLIIKMKKKKIR
jgi:hypothetical protein